VLFFFGFFPIDRREVPLLAMLKGFGFVLGIL
jgi:hypothetical protein